MVESRGFSGLAEKKTLALSFFHDGFVEFDGAISSAAISSTAVATTATAAGSTTAVAATGAGC